MPPLYRADRHSALRITKKPISTNSPRQTWAARVGVKIRPDFAPNDHRRTGPRCLDAGIARAPHGSGWKRRRSGFGQKHRRISTRSGADQIPNDALKNRRHLRHPHRHNESMSRRMIGRRDRETANAAGSPGIALLPSRDSIEQADTSPRNPESRQTASRQHFTSQAAANADQSLAELTSPAGCKRFIIHLSAHKSDRHPRSLPCGCKRCITKTIPPLPAQDNKPGAR